MSKMNVPIHPRTGVGVRTMLQTVRYKGRMYRVPATPFEPQERLADRAWFVATTVSDAAPEQRRGGRSGSDGGAELLSESHRWANEKYFKMSY